MLSTGGKTPSGTFLRRHWLGVYFTVLGLLASVPIGVHLLFPGVQLPVVVGVFVMVFAHLLAIICGVGLLFQRPLVFKVLGLGHIVLGVWWLYTVWVALGEESPG